jgi:hypothetical protein
MIILDSAADGSDPEDASEVIPFLVFAHPQAGTMYYYDWRKVSWPY